MNEIIHRLNKVAHDPERATDLGTDTTDLKGNPVHYIAHPPLSAAEVEDAEGRLGFRLPELLRRMYMEVGNGGFGPGYGFLPLIKDGSKESVIGHYTMDPDHRGILKDYLPIAYWGCTIYSYLDIGEDNGLVIALDLDIEVDELAEMIHSPLKEQLPVQAKTLEQFVTKWLDGIDLFEEVFGSYED